MSMHCKKNIQFIHYIYTLWTRFDSNRNSEYIYKKEVYWKSTSLYLNILALNYRFKPEAQWLRVICNKNLKALCNYNNCYAIELRENWEVLVDSYSWNASVMIHIDIITHPIFFYAYKIIDHWSKQYKSNKLTFCIFFYLCWPILF